MSKKFFALLLLGMLTVGAAGIVTGQEPVPVPVPCDGTGCDGCGGCGGGPVDCDNDCDNDCDD